MEPSTPLPDTPAKQVDGAVTFLFTDIEGSTQLWEQQPEGMRPALARHDALLRSAIEGHRGHVFKTMGDQFCAVFGTAHEAVQAAAAAQRALAGAPLVGALPGAEGHPRGVPLRVRIALHTGEAATHEGDYFGPPLNRVSRLLSAGHGGQVLLSQATAEVVRSALPAQMTLRSLGAHRLRDLPEREMIFQLVIPDLPADFPPLNTLDVAFRRGLLRATAIAGVVLAVVAGLALVAVNQRRIAQQGQRELRRHLYAAQMSVVQEAWRYGNLAQAVSLLKAQALPGQEDLRGFEWRYFWRLCQQSDAPVSFQGHKGSVGDLRYSPNGRLLASSSRDDKTVRLWDVRAKREVVTLPWVPKPDGWDLVENVAFSPDSRLLAVSSGKPGHGTVRLWDTGDRRELPPLEGHTGWINALVFSPNGKTLATASSDRTVRLWELPSRRAVATLVGHKDEVTRLAFSPDGKLLASGADGIARLWAMPGGQLRRTLKVRSRLGISHLAFSPNGRTLALSAGDPPIELWNAATGQAGATLQGHRSALEEIAFSPNGNLLASASDDNTVKLWDVRAGHEAATLEGHRSVVLSVAFSPDGKLLASAGDDLTARLWDVTTKQEMVTLRGHRAGVRRVVFSPDGQQLATGSGDGIVKLWDVRIRDFDLLPSHRSAIQGLTFSSDGRRLASTHIQDGIVKLWDLGRPGSERRPRELAEIKVPTTGRRPLAFSPDGTILAICCDDTTVMLWDVDARRKIRSLPGPVRWPTFAAFSPDGKTLAFSSSDYSIRLWKLPAPGPEGARRALPDGALKGHTAGVYMGAFSPDGKLLASGGDDQTVRLWNVATRQNVATSRHPGGINDLAFRPDGQLLATGGWSHAVKLWDVPTMRERASLPGHTGIIDTLAFSRDGKTLATGGGGRVITLWNVVTEQPLATLAGHEAQVGSVSFSPDGNLLVSSSSDGIRLWRAATLAEAEGADRAHRK